MRGWVTLYAIVLYYIAMYSNVVHWTIVHLTRNCPVKIQWFANKIWIKWTKAASMLRKIEFLSQGQSIYSIRMVYKFQRHQNLHKFTLTKGDFAKKKEKRLLSLKKHHLAVFCIDPTTKLCYDYIWIDLYLIHQLFRHCVTKSRSRGFPYKI